MDGQPLPKKLGKEEVKGRQRDAKKRTPPKRGSLGYYREERTPARPTAGALRHEFDRLGPVISGLTLARLWHDSGTDKVLMKGAAFVGSSLSSGPTALGGRLGEIQSQRHAAAKEPPLLIAEFLVSQDPPLMQFPEPVEPIEPGVLGVTVVCGESPDGRANSPASLGACPTGQLTY